MWTGNFKGLDIGHEDYQIAPHIWEAIGMETASAVQHIPASFVRVLDNIACDQSYFTAESWCFWFLYLAPKLLDNRFPKKKYYSHMCELVEIMKIMLQFTITASSINNIEGWLINWVQKYEK